jgi:hypothetical protein
MKIFFINCLRKIRKRSIIRYKDFRINSTFKSDFLVYLGLLSGGKYNSSISRILISNFYYFFLNLWFIITYLGQL